MKRLSILTLLILVSIVTYYFQSCKKPDDVDNHIWTTEIKAYVNEITTLQDQAGQNFKTWTESMDSLAAIEKLNQFFLDNPNVSYTKVGSQGISVQYSNGTRGGIMLKSQRMPVRPAGMEVINPNPGLVRPETKSVVNNKKMILFDASYSEVRNGEAFKDFTDQVINSHRLNLPKVKFSLDKVYTDEEATLERYTQLSGYGIIDLASHGFPWEDSTGITDVYMLTGEAVSENMKYLDDLTNRSIIILQYEGANKYWISEKFISDHNNFSRDTVLFIGSFCYSFRGKWPGLQKSFADGAYVGYNRSITLDWFVDWDSDLIYCLSDTSKSPLMNMADWMNDPRFAKNYTSEVDHSDIHIEFAGDSTLTLLPDTTSTVKDVDGNVYHVKKYGKQFWTLEDLKTTRFNDGSAIPLVTDNVSWPNLSSPAYCWYMNDPLYKIDYGALYNWFAVSSKKLAPKGWHIPTMDEWNALISYLGGNAVAGGKMKETGTQHWKVPNEGATNSSGFRALPGGCRYKELWNGIYYYNMGFAANWWTSSEWNNELAHFIQIRYDLVITELIQMYKPYGFAVRCVKN
jgi:uncharacterized protein (TIGR02145 family)